MMTNESDIVAHLNFDLIVEQHYRNLFRFAMSLSKSEDRACDLTQQTFYLLAAKGHQLRDPSKVKSWLFTTLHREFLKTAQRECLRPHIEIGSIEHELPLITPEFINKVDVDLMMSTLQTLDEMFRVPLMLFHLENYSYKEIAAMLEIPIGTIMSRLSRGRELLFRHLADRISAEPSKVIPLADHNNLPNHPSEKRLKF